MPVARAVVFELEGVGEFEGSSSGGLFGESRVVVRLSVQRLSKLGLLVQQPPSRLATAVWEPAVRLERLGGRLCRFHEDVEGEPFYCVKPAVTRDGYCREHAESWKALYERCAQGDDEACSRVAGSLAEKFAVYALDYGGSKLKIGLTQSWRIAWRIAEQPHVAAALLATGSLEEMRCLERELGRRPAATEGAGIRLVERVERAVKALSASRFEVLARRLASLLLELGLEGEFQAVTILPRFGLEIFAGAEARSIEDLVGAELRLIDYWAGELVLEDRRGERFLIDKLELLHRVLDAEVRLTTRERGR
ncbi:MAG: hypothetical protein QXT79_06090 [Thermofilaceae archaeon]